MGKRLVSLLTALALAVSAFASLTVAPAGAVVENLGVEIYFPFLPNGEEYGNMGPWYSTFTIQNPTNAPVRLQVYRANGDVVTTVNIEPFASKTWPSSAVFGSNPGGGIYVGAEASLTLRIRKGVANGQDVLNIPNWCRATINRVYQGATVYVQGAGADYTVGTTFVPNDTINWNPRGNEPPTNTEYSVDVNCAQPPIAGVAKIVAPVASNSGRTSGQQEAVSGYTALPVGDVRIAGQHNLVFPIVQTNSGWNSVLHITNFDSKSNCSVTVTLYQSPSGDTDPSFGNFTRLLNRGQTVHIDLADEGVPAGWVGQAWVSTDCHVAATVDRVKPTQPWGDPVNMALTNQALPTAAGNNTQALPLVFQSYNGWNTGISIANLDPNATANVTITYYNSAGVAMGTESRRIQPRAMEFVYKPATTDVGIGGFGSALVTSNTPVLVAVDSVKYTGTGQDVGQALGYLAQAGTPGVGQLYMPLFQKQGQLSGGNDNSGVALFNAGGVSASVQIDFYDSSGARVAPTLAGPITATIPAHGGFIAYAPSYGEMPGGFQGSVVVSAIGSVAGVSNNVNYDVQFDGSAAYNMPGVGTASVTCAPAQGIVPGDLTADATITGQLGIAVAGVPVLLEIVDERALTGTGDDVSFFGPPPPDVDVSFGFTIANGQFQQNAFLGARSTVPVTFTVNFYWDANNSFLLEPSDVLLATTTCTL
jgi:hypothetical protein